MFNAVHQIFIECLLCGRWWGYKHVYNEIPCFQRAYEITENNYFGDINFFHKCILKNLIAHFERIRIIFFLFVHIFIMARTKWKLSIIVDRLIDLGKNCCQVQVNSFRGPQRR